MRSKPYCKAPWIGLTYESTIGCKPCCEYIGGNIGINPGSFKGIYTDYIKSDWLKDFKKMMYKDEMNPNVYHEDKSIRNMKSMNMVITKLYVLITDQEINAIYHAECVIRNIHLCVKRKKLNVEI